MFSVRQRRLLLLSGTFFVMNLWLIYYTKITDHMQLHYEHFMTLLYSKNEIDNADENETDIEEINVFTQANGSVNTGNETAGERCIISHSGKHKSLNKCTQLLRIFVIVYDRTKSLLRLLSSLNEANYLNDMVKLEIWIDRSLNGKVSGQTLDTASNFVFKHGLCEVIVQDVHVGLYGQWLNTYVPIPNCSEIVVILEDDLTVSKHFYSYLKLVHKKYRDYEGINGFSLQGGQIKFAAGSSGHLSVPPEEPVFLYPVLGTWGFSPRADKWLGFLNWVKNTLQNKSFKPYVPNHTATRWYKEHERKNEAKNMWSMWHIYYAWINKEFTLYSNFQDRKGLVTHWAEKGLHYSVNDVGKPSNPLLSGFTLTLAGLPNKVLKIDISGRIIGRG